MELADVLNKANFLTSRFYYNQRINLYVLDNKLYEVWYEPGENRISSMKGISWHKARKLYKGHELLLSPN